MPGTASGRSIASDDADDGQPAAGRGQRRRLPQVDVAAVAGEPAAEPADPVDAVGDQQPQEAGGAERRTARKLTLVGRTATGTE